LKEEVFPPDVLCPYSEFGISIPYIGEETDPLLDAQRRLPKPYWSPEGVDFYSGVIAMEGAIPDSYDYIWVNGTNDAYKFTKFKRLT